LPGASSFYISGTCVHKSGSAWRCPTLLINRCMWRRAMPCDPPGFARRCTGFSL
jgi:hypothetical protein